MGMPATATSANIMCTFGMAPSTLVATPSPVLIEGKPAATVMDFAPGTNIPPFGMCMSPSNPTVAAATAAALGVLTPMPCIPATAPWQPGAVKTIIAGKPALTSTSKCMCAYGGVISILFPATVKTLIG
ncbi:MAG: hypothetical protein QOG64_301 [Acidimicrobiaceae bacterium]|jgi:hypothetical protein|nr:hypothetical protein [Acidimicrobiaceae bacterium]